MVDVVDYCVICLVVFKDVFDVFGLIYEVEVVFVMEVFVEWLVIIIVLGVYVVVVGGGDVCIIGMVGFK